jgi:hypothetical protein
MNDHTEVFHLMDLKDTFLGFQVEIVFCEDAQNIVDNALVKSGVVRGVDEDVIYVNCDISLVDQVAKYVVHH